MAPRTDIVAHRPWPLPSAPWVMSQTWRHVLMAHWRVPVATLQALVPEGLEVEAFDGTGWFGVFPIYMHALHARGLPAIPGTTEFPELNVRTYVRRGGKSGVFFFSLDCSNRLAVEAARATFGLNYLAAEMRFEETAKGIEYESRRSDERAPDASFLATYLGLGDLAPAAPGTLEHFLCERYCLYSSPKPGKIMRGEIHHEPWPLQAGSATIDLNTMGEPLGVALEGEPHLLYSPGVEAAIWLPSEC